MGVPRGMAVVGGRCAGCGGMGWGWAGGGGGAPTDCGGTVIGCLQRGQVPVRPMNSGFTAIGCPQAQKKWITAPAPPLAGGS